jgi:hypothetical protein
MSMMRLSRVFVAACSMIFIVAACADDDGPNAAGAKHDAPATGPDGGPATPIASKTVGAGGGTVTSPDGVTIEVPPNAVKADTTFVIATAQPPVAMAANVVGTTYAFGPAGVQFDVPIRITIPFDAARLRSDSDVADVRVLAATDTGDDFVAIGAVALERGKVAFATDHFSRYVASIERDCAPPGAQAYNECSLWHCRAGYHAEGHAVFGQGVLPTCMPDGFFLGTYCVPNTTPFYETTEFGCRFGYYYAGSATKFPGVPWSSHCVLIEGLSYDPCEFGCRPGFHREDRPQGGLLCGLPFNNLCVSDTGKAVTSVCGFSSSTKDGGPTTTDAGPTAPGDLRVEAFIDGLSQLVIQGTTVHWHHLKSSAPGRWAPFSSPPVAGNEPTRLNGVSWQPVWPDQNGSPPARNESCDCDSSATQVAGLPSAPTHALVKVAQARDHVTVTQPPTAANGYTTIVEFSDQSLTGDTSSNSGADWYDATIHLE